MKKENKVMYVLVTDSEIKKDAEYKNAVVVKVNYTVDKFERNVVSKLSALDTKARKAGKEYLGIKRAYSTLSATEEQINKYGMIEI